ncbi:hypothetical protein RZS08_51490, partial [Arthrospira platensis SPKY1]|nr:hypothetical protein [Arthrospira platensis SPKY1]
MDYGVMEKAKSVMVFQVTDIGWSDVGSWKAWADAAGYLSPQGEDSNSCSASDRGVNCNNQRGNFSKGDVALLDSE